MAQVSSSSNVVSLATRKPLAEAAPPHSGNPGLVALLEYMLVLARAGEITSLAASGLGANDQRFVFSTPPDLAMLGGLGLLHVETQAEVARKSLKGRYEPHASSDAS